MFTRFTKWLSHEWADYEFGSFDGARFTSTYWGFFCTMLWMAKTTILCRYLGHNWVDDSYAGPDSGNMSHYCTRCGESHSVTLY